MSIPRRAARPSWPLLGCLALVVILATGACEITLSATSTPDPVVGGAVFAAVRWRDQDQAIDVVFIPDDDYGDMNDVADRQVFLDDVANMIDTGFYQNNAIVSNIAAINFWFMTATGNVAEPDEGICPDVTWPDLTAAAFAESIVMLHTNALRDCAFGNQVTSEPTSFRTVVHEFSHAAWGLPDEYCCDGGYFVTPPVFYAEAADCTGDADNAPWRDCDTFTASSGEDWTRSEDDTDDIMSVGGSVVLEYGQADWFVMDGILSGLGFGAAQTPDVFAPDPWDWP
ncbi:MAG: hypothetical protein ACRDHL_14795 [Candidatus Promineifilaceae bacterium]